MKVTICPRAVVAIVALMIAVAVSGPVRGDTLVLGTAWGVPWYRASSAADAGIEIGLSVGIPKFKTQWGTLQSAELSAIGFGDYDWEYTNTAPPSTPFQAQFVAAIYIEQMTMYEEGAAIRNNAFPGNPPGSIDLDTGWSYGLAVDPTTLTTVTDATYAVTGYQYLQADVSWDSSGNGEAGDPSDTAMPGSISGTFSGFAFLTYQYTPSATPPHPRRRRPGWRRRR